MRTVTVEPAIVLRPSLKGRAVHLEGGLFGPDFLERLERGDLPGQRPADFGIRPGRSVVEEAAEAYRDAQDLWRVFRRRLERLPEDDPATSLTREGWMIPLLGLLGYEPRYNPKAYDVDGVSYAISHRAGESEDAPPVHIVGARRELGRVDPSGRPRLSPHALLQEFLNRSEHLWGIVTNGRVLRLLRKSTFLRRPAYVEFDLEMIFEAEGGERFGDFLLLYRLLHRSRLPKGIEDAHECWLERYYQEALEQGNRARDRMRDGVEECLKILGTGFLRANPGWRADPAQLYTDLLRLVYRFLFLLVAEERGLLGGNDLYREHYSVSRLRRLVDRLEAYTEHDDLWQSLRVLWHLLRDPTPQADGRPLASLLGLPVLDGGLFEPIPLEGLTISNRDLLCAFYYLTYYYDEEAHTDRWVNYAALDVEELGSVYESLLDNHPVIEDTPDGPVFTFTEGTERKSTGSYYTPPELVQELIRSALEPVLEEKLRQAKDPKAKAQAILSIKVLDPATGSGHFLLAAARRLGKELARVRTGEEEPSPEALREATREVIAHCIYGVDKNPLAVELCKVALWIESQVPGKPLTFLDHRIRVGDSLVGVLDLAALKEGIPDAAYEPAQGDDREVARALKRRNAEERSGQMSFLGAHLGDPRDALRQSAREALEVEAIPDDTLEEIARKARRHQALRRSLNPLRQAADLWTAAFFQEKKRGKPAITTDAVRRSLAGQPVHGQVVGLAEALAQEHRFFHWPLEFPEVFAQGGFDVVLGNPPFMGGLKVSGTLGPRYRRWLEVAFTPYRGTADSCAAFYRRAFALLRAGGRLGMVATNTISQGDTRESGLKVIVKQDGVITFARRFIQWPGAANVEVNLVAIHKRGRDAPVGRVSCVLDGQPVPFISSRLDDMPEAEPRRLRQNEGKAFIGDYVRGIGFVLEPGEAEELLAKNPRNADCLFPYLNGEDLNNNPEQRPSRWVICFHDWPLERAREYPDLLAIVKARVKPEREKLRNDVSGYDRLKQNWWLYAAFAKGMRQAIAPLRRVLVRSRIAELHALVFVPTGWVYNEKTIVFAFDDDYHFALLQSSIHESWMRRFTSTLRTDINYAPTDCFDTFPFPPAEYAERDLRALLRQFPFAEAARIGAEYHEHRRQVMLERQLGLTKVYNLFHNPQCKDADILRLRDLHIAMDRAVLACYGWEDIDLKHDFYTNERDQVRFCPSREARREILFRLLRLNAELSRQAQV
ncbi:MAG TPA: DNA methyltransferase [Thermoflexus sp.]|nr:DNA methyltransferase [Thermoflexus sp.]